MHGCASPPVGSSVGPAADSALPGAEHHPVPVADGQQPAVSLSARGMRRLDVLRRSEDRAPPYSR
jgi:hypothetical protein